MPEASPVASPITEACADPVAAHQEMMRPYIEALARAEKYETSKSHYPHWLQCCPELQPKIESLRPFDTDLEELKSIPNETRMFADHQECMAQYFGAPAGGGDSPFASWFSGQLETNRAHWQQQYGDLDKELLSCCVMKFGECLYQETGVRSCTQKLTREEPPPDAPAAPAAAPAAVETAPVPGAAETQQLSMLEQLNTMRTGDVVIFLVLGVVVALVGFGLGWLLMAIASRIFGDRVLVPLAYLRKVLSFPFRWFGRRRSPRRVPPAADRKAESA